MEPCLDAVIFGWSGRNLKRRGFRIWAMQVFPKKKTLWYSWYGKGLDSKALKRNANLWDCKRPNGSKWHIRLGMIGSASPSRNLFSMSVFFWCWFRWIGRQHETSSLHFYPRNLMLWCKKLHEIRKPAHFSYLSTTASSSHQSFSKIWHWDGSCICKIVLEFDERWIHFWTNIGIKQKISIGVARIWCLTISKVISPERIVSICEPYVAMFISNLITL